MAGFPTLADTIRTFSAIGIDEKTIHPLDETHSALDLRTFADIKSQLGRIMAVKGRILHTIQPSSKE